MSVHDYNIKEPVFSSGCVLDYLTTYFNSGSVFLKCTVIWNFPIIYIYVYSSPLILWHIHCNAKHTHKNNVFNKHHVYFSTMHSVVVHKHHHCAWNLLELTGWCVECSLYYSVPLNTAKWTRCKATSTRNWSSQ